MSQVRSSAPTTRATAEIAVIGAVFLLYAAFLLKVLLFARVPGTERSINLVPFASISDYASSSSSESRRFALAEVAGNVLLFIPLGFYAALPRRGSTIGRSMIVVAAVSLCIEILQGLFAVGVSDIDDVTLNCVGGLTGILAYRLYAASCARAGSAPNHHCGAVTGCRPRRCAF